MANDLNSKPFSCPDCSQLVGVTITPATPQAALVLDFHTTVGGAVCPGAQQVIAIGPAITEALRSG